VSLDRQSGNEPQNRARRLETRLEAVRTEFWRKPMAINLSRRSLIYAALFLLPVLGATQASAADQTVRVGIMSAEDEDIWSVVSQEALKRGLTVKLSVFNDYTQPNEALENGELDANAFQHKPYLDNQIKTRGYHIVPVGYTAV
jgi:D-methionine transport system substrate-binding protein